MLDLIFHTSGLSITWTSRTNTDGSNHFHRLISFAGDSTQRTSVVRSVCWDAFRAVLLRKTKDPLEAIVRSLTQAVTLRRVPLHYPEPDWRLHQLLALKKRAHRKSRRTRKEEYKHELKKACAKTRKYCVRLGYRWISFCASIGRKEDMSRICFLVPTAVRHMVTPHECALGLLQYDRCVAEVMTAKHVPSQRF